MYFIKWRKFYFNYYKNSILCYRITIEDNVKLLNISWNLLLTLLKHYLNDKQKNYLSYINFNFYNIALFYNFSFQIILTKYFLNFK